MLSPNHRECGMAAIPKIKIFPWTVFFGSQTECRARLFFANFFFTFELGAAATFHRIAFNPSPPHNAILHHWSFWVKGPLLIPWTDLFETFLGSCAYLGTCTHQNRPIWYINSNDTKIEPYSDLPYNSITRHKIWYCTTVAQNIHGPCFTTPFNSTNLLALGPVLFSTCFHFPIFVPKKGNKRLCKLDKAR